MYKELIISILVIILIIIGNAITQSNTNRAVSKLNHQLEELKEEIIKKDINKNNTILKFENIEKNWKNENKKMAYYIEHNELEKVENEIAKIRANIETKDYISGIENLESCIFILSHIKNKTVLKILNIF